MCVPFRANVENSPRTKPLEREVVNKLPNYLNCDEREIFFPVFD